MFDRKRLSAIIIFLSILRLVWPYSFIFYVGIAIAVFLSHDYILKEMAVIVGSPKEVLQMLKNIFEEGDLYALGVMWAFLFSILSSAFQGIVPLIHYACVGVPMTLYLLLLCE